MMIWEQVNVVPRSHVGMYLYCRDIVVGCILFSSLFSTRHSLVFRSLPVLRIQHHNPSLTPHVLNCLA